MKYSASVAAPNPTLHLVYSLTQSPNQGVGAEYSCNLWTPIKDPQSEVCQDKWGILKQRGDKAVWN
jgi:hypothetical protein